MHSRSFTIAEAKHTQRPSGDERVSEMRPVPTVPYYSALERRDILTRASTLKTRCRVK